MTRIFSTMAVVAMLLLAITLIMGLAIGEPGQQWLDYRTEIQSGTEQTAAGKKAALLPVLESLSNHRLAGIGTGIFVLLVHSLSITYFIGTSRWCREVAETYQLPEDLIAEGLSNKRRNFPWAFLGMIAVLVLAAFGALADPSRIPEVPGALESSLNWVTPHQLLAFATVAFTAFCFFMEYQQIAIQGELIQRMMGYVKDVRQAKGLATVEDEVPSEV